jgi:hypothetical protein
VYTKTLNINGVTIELKLNQAEAEMVATLPEALRQQVADSLLNAKAESQSTLIANRTTFSIKINDVGTIVIRGLGNRYPTGLRPDSLRILLAHVPELTKAVTDAEAYVAANPEKVKAGLEAREKARSEAEAKAEAKAAAKAAKKLTLVPAAVVAKA